MIKVSGNDAAMGGRKRAWISELDSCKKWVKILPKFEKIA